MKVLSIFGLFMCFCGIFINSQVCYGIEKDKSSVCLSRGECIQNDTCLCNRNYHGVQCEFREDILWKPLKLETIENSQFDVIGIFSDSVFPGNRVYGMTQVISEDELFLFGGLSLLPNGNVSFEYSNFIYVYSMSKGQWKIHKFTNASHTAIYNEEDSYSKKTNPGYLYSFGYVTLSENETMIFGGRNHNDELRNDMWIYQRIKNEFKFVRGEKENPSICGHGAFNTTFNSAHFPRLLSRFSLSKVYDGIYLFGGHSQECFTIPGEPNEMWVFNITLKQWRFIRGRNFSNAENHGYYNWIEKGEYHVNNYIPGLQGHMTWVSGNEIAIFGGDSCVYNPFPVNYLWFFHTETELYKCTICDNTKYQIRRSIEAVDEHVELGLKYNFHPNNHPAGRYDGGVFPLTESLYIIIGGNGDKSAANGHIWVYDMLQHEFAYVDDIEGGENVLSMEYHALNQPNEIHYGSSVVKFSESEIIIIGGFESLTNNGSIWIADMSKFTTCFGVLYNDISTCNGHGTCAGYNVCICDIGWIGENCSFVERMRWKPLKIALYGNNPIVGTMGLFSNSVTPGAVNGGMFLKMNEDEFIHFGGKIKGNRYISNLIFVYSLSRNQWMRIKGVNKAFYTQNAVYGTTNMFHDDNHPSYIRNFNFEKINEFEVMIFGGFMKDVETTANNNLWVYNYQYNTWKFVWGFKNAPLECGSSTFIRDYDEINVPMLLRFPGMTKVDNYLYVVGGVTLCSYEQTTNNMWAFDLQSLKWKFLKGNKLEVVHEQGYFTSLKEYHEDNIIGRISRPLLWVVESEIIIFGGLWKDNIVFEKYSTNNLWYFNTNTENYKCMRHGTDYILLDGAFHQPQIINAFGRYHESNLPLGTAIASSWQISPFVFAIYGGFPKSGVIRYMWTYDYRLDQFLPFDRDISQNEIIGTPGIYDWINNPSQRQRSHVTSVSDDEVLIMGGLLADESSQYNLWMGDISQYHFCFGVHREDVSVCSSHGECWGLDECNCEPGYIGENCDVFTCSGFAPNTTEVCNNLKGSCIGPNECVCIDRYYGNNCEIGPEFICDGIGSFDTSLVCNGRGECIADGNCLCRDPFYGDFCENIISGTVCFGYADNDVRVCNSHGTCSNNDICECEEGFNGLNCENFLCFGEFEDFKVCSGRGICEDVDICVCEEFYFGDICELTECFGIRSNDSSVCGGKGKCLSRDYCECNDTISIGDCVNAFCYGLSASDPFVCSGHGICNATNECFCENHFEGFECSELVCFGKSGLDSCSGRGQCQEVDGTCNCPNGYIGDECEIPICFGESNTSLVCNSHGNCIGHNECHCFADDLDGFYGGSACSTCDSNYEGTNCNIRKVCDSITTCNNNGICDVDNRTCKCFSDSLLGYWAPPYCSECIWSDENEEGYYPPNACLHFISSNSTCNGNGVVNKNTATCDCYKEDSKGYFMGETCTQCEISWFSGDCKRKVISDFVIKNDLKSLEGYLKLPDLLDFKCENILSEDFLSIIGSDSICTYRNERDLFSIFFGSVRNYTALIELKSVSINLVPENDEEDVFQDVLLEFPKSLIGLSAEIDAFSRIGYCSTYKLDGSKSSGDTYKWRCYSGPFKDHINDFLISNGLDEEMEIHIPDNFFRHSSTYVFELKTSLGSSDKYTAKAYHSMSVDSVSIPKAFVKGGKVQYAVASKYFKLQGGFEIESNCSTGNNEVNYFWRQTSGPPPKVVDGNIVLSNKYLSFPKNSLIPGVKYTFIFTTFSVYNPNIRTSATVHLNVVDYDIECNILGGSERNIFTGNNISFVASSNVFDSLQDGAYERYAWKCRKKNGGFCVTKNNEEKIDDIFNINRINQLLPWSMDIGTYEFEVTYVLGSVVTKCHQRVNIGKYEMPEVFINEIFVRGKISLDGMIVYPNSTIEDNLVQHYAFKWELLSPKNIILEDIVLSNSLQYDTLVINESKLSKGIDFVFSFSTYDSREGDIATLPTGTAKTIVKLNVPPFGGTCNVSPLIGEMFITEYTISCSNWVDLQMPLTYRFGYIDENENEVILSPQSLQSKFSFTIPIQNEVKIIFYVYDRRGAFVSGVSSVHVLPRNVKSETIKEYMELVLLEREGDFEGTLELLTNVVQLLSNKNDSNALEIRGDIAKILLSLSEAFSDVQNDEQTVQIQSLIANVLSNSNLKAKVNESVSFDLSKFINDLANFDDTNIGIESYDYILQALSALLESLNERERELFNSTVIDVLIEEEIDIFDERRSVFSMEEMYYYNPNYYQYYVIIERVKKFVSDMTDFEIDLTDTIKKVIKAIMKSIFASEKGHKISTKNLATTVITHTEAFFTNLFEMEETGNGKLVGLGNIDIEIPDSVWKVLKKKKSPKKHGKGSELSRYGLKKESKSSGYVRSNQYTASYTRYYMPPHRYGRYNVNSSYSNINNNPVSSSVDVVVLNDRDDVEVDEFPMNETVSLNYTINKDAITIQPDENEFVDEEDEEREEDYELRCCFWDEKLKAYSTKGCTTIGNSYGTYKKKKDSSKKGKKEDIECKCSHLTEFVIIAQKIPPWSCNGVMKNESFVCSGHGLCTSPDVCECNATHFGYDCQHHWCYGIEHNFESVCSYENGICKGPNECECKEGYGGDTCDEWTCNGVDKNHESVCNGFGKCFEYNECSCDNGFEGNDCEICRREVCNYGGDCNVIESGIFNCDCDDEHITGQKCEICYAPDPIIPSLSIIGIYDMGVCVVDFESIAYWNEINRYCKMLKGSFNHWKSLDIVVVKSGRERDFYCSTF